VDAESINIDDPFNEWVIRQTNQSFRAYVIIVRQEIFIFMYLFVYIAHISH
jgi:hypothetical protein